MGNLYPLYKYQTHQKGRRKDLLMTRPTYEEEKKRIAKKKEPSFTNVLRYNTSKLAISVFLFFVRSAEKEERKFHLNQLCVVYYLSLSPSVYVKFFYVRVRKEERKRNQIKCLI